MSYQPKLGLIRGKRSLILIHCDCVMWCYTQSLNHCSKQRHAQQILSPQMTHHSETNRSALWEARMQLSLEHFPSTFRLLRKFDIRNGGNPNVHRMLSSLEPGWADLLVRWYEGKGYVNAHEVVMEGICSIAQKIEPSGGVKRSHGRSDQYQMQWRTKHRFGKSNSNLICIRMLFGLCIRTLYSRPRASRTKAKSPDRSSSLAILSSSLSYLVDFLDLVPGPIFRAARLDCSLNHLVPNSECVRSEGAIALSGPVKGCCAISGSFGIKL